MGKQHLTVDRINGGKTTMRIAILGWGSLLHDPRNLSTEGDWQLDGPWLPIEFARISKEDRLTLVLVDGTERVRTYWIVSGKTTLSEARENLRERETCATVEGIAFLCRDGSSHFVPFPRLETTISEWLRMKGDLDAAIWTDLRSNFREKTSEEFSIDNAERWLQGLITKEKAKGAENYIRKAPTQTDTPLRRRVRERFGWTNLSNWEGVGVRGPK